MNAWRQRRARKAAEKQRRAYDRLHGRGAVSRPPARRRDYDWADDAGELIVDILTALPRGILWLIAKALD